MYFKVSSALQALLCNWLPSAQHGMGEIALTLVMRRKWPARQKRNYVGSMPSELGDKCRSRRGKHHGKDFLFHTGSRGVSERKWSKSIRLLTASWYPDHNYLRFCEVVSQYSGPKANDCCWLAWSTTQRGYIREYYHMLIFVMIKSGSWTPEFWPELIVSTELSTLSKVLINSSSSRTCQLRSSEHLDNWSLKKDFYGRQAGCHRQVVDLPQLQIAR